MKPDVFYRRHLPKLGAWQTLEIVAAMEFMNAIDTDRTPAHSSLTVLYKAMQRMVEGEAPDKVWRQGRGKPADNGISPDMVVSAYIELQRRRSIGANPLRDAKALAVVAFKIGGPTVDARRQIDRHWQQGSANVESLDSDDLERIIEPYKDPDNPV